MIERTLFREGIYFQGVVRRSIDSESCRFMPRGEGTNCARETVAQAGAKASLCTVARAVRGNGPRLPIRP